MAIVVRAPTFPHQSEVLSREALAFLEDLHRRFDARRRDLLAHRLARQARLDAGERPGFLPETRSVREGDWKVAPAPKDLEDRRVEITGPTDRKMVINALNSGARVFMADFEDANAPTWENLVQGQVNLADAIERRIDFTTPEGKSYRLNERTATLLVRPRGWHLEEKHVLVDGAPMSGSLFDFGLYVFHNAKRLLAKGSGPYFYFPKLESHLEARLWNDVCRHAEATLGLPRGAIKATVLIETILAAFEMDEVLFELRERSAGLNAGRWDYLFSVIKKFRSTDLVWPDRGALTMKVPFMRAYTQLLVATCHKRGAHAIGGMSAFIPNRRDAAVTETALKAVREDKAREAGDGCDGTWVAHPDLVPVAREVFDAALGTRPNQLGKLRPDVDVQPKDLLDFRVAGDVTEAGLRANVGIGIQYIASWLGGVGAAALHNLMEDAATAEISRSQVWQWVHRGATLKEGPRVTKELVRRVADEEVARMREALGPEAFDAGRFKEARALFEEVALSDAFVDFLTLPAYDRL